MSSSAAPSLRSTIGFLLCRIVVPLWVLTGASFKLIEASPRLLPRNILNVADGAGVDLFLLLAVLIAIEFVAAMIMFFVGRWARPVAIFMLTVFCLILIGEIVSGNTSCGCLGKHSPSPWAMLIVDAAMLLGVILFAPRRAERPAPAWPGLVAGVLALALAGTSFGVLIPRSNGVVQGNGNGTTPTNGTNGGTPDGNGGNGGEHVHVPKPLEAYWYSTQEKLDAWVGSGWRDVDLLQYMPELPADLDTGTRYVVFYGRTCDHCEVMFKQDLAPHPELARQVTAIEVPFDAQTLTSRDGWSMPKTEATLMALPVGTDWIITTPLALRIEDGIVACAVEGEHHECFGLEGGHEH